MLEMLDLNQLEVFHADLSDYMSEVEDGFFAGQSVGQVLKSIIDTSNEYAPDYMPQEWLDTGRDAHGDKFLLALLIADMAIPSGWDSPLLDDDRVVAVQELTARLLA